MRKINLAIVGATGAVGEVALTILAQRQFPIDKLYLVASKNSAGRTISFQGETLPVVNLEDFDFKKANIAIFSIGKEIATEYAPLAVASNCFVIDNSAAFRYQDEVPLIVTEVNGHLLEKTASRIISNPNCSTIQMIVAIKPIYDAVGIKTINVATYQSVSGQGREAMLELIEQTKAVINNKAIPHQVFKKQIAFNVLPEIDQRQENGFTFEEMKMVWETQKILADQTVLVNPTTVRVPVMVGHAMAVHIETKQPISLTQAEQLLMSAPGVIYQPYKSEGSYPTQITEAEGNDAVFVGRLRKNLACEQGINMWVVSDNLRKGAALNAIQIAEKLITYNRI